MNKRRQLWMWRIVHVAAGFGAIVTASLGAVNAVAVDEALAPIQVTGTGSDMFPRQLIEWQNDLLGAQQPVDFDFVPKGARDGRTAFLDGKNDVVITGLPFTDAELATRPAAAGPLIEAPVHVAAAMVLLTPPYPMGLEQQTLVCDPDDPDEAHPERCIVRSPVATPVKIPPENLAAMMLDLDIDNLNKWQHPKLLEALGAPDLNIAFGRRPLWVHRSEGSAMNHFLLEYVRRAAPNVWASAKSTFPFSAWEPTGEVVPLANKVSRKGLDAQIQAVANWVTNPKTGVLDTNSSAGIIGGVPPSAIEIAKEIYPKTIYLPVSVRNGSGEWIAATPESISAAVEAGGDAPLYALDHAAPGAYPLTWINRLYVSPTGLSVEKTNAVASLIRYLATDGQSGAAALGEGRLSSVLVAEALAAADKVVVSNCTGADRHVETTTDPGPDAPDLPGLKAIGLMAHCVAGPLNPATTTTVADTTTVATTTTVVATTVPSSTSTSTTTAASTTTTTEPNVTSPRAPTAQAVSPTPPRPNPSPTTAPAVTEPPPVIESSVVAPAEETTTLAPAVQSASAPTDPPHPTTVVPRPRLRRELPLPAPGGGERRLDRVVTLLLGAGLFIGLRRVARSQLGALRTAYDFSMVPT